MTFAGERLNTQGERYAFEAVRRPEGWRLSSIRVAPIWVKE